MAKGKHKMRWVFMRGGRAKINCSCGLQSSIGTTDSREAKEALINDLKGKHSHA